MTPMSPRCSRTPARPVALLLVTVLALIATACVGSGKTARAQSIEPLPPGIEIFTDVTMGCREGESGFDYRFLVVGKTSDLSNSSPLLTTLRAHGFYHSDGIAEDLPWITVGYQNEKYPLRAELGSLHTYLANPRARQGPDPASIPAEIRAQSDQYVLIAMRPTDFLCTTPL